MRSHNHNHNRIHLSHGHNDFSQVSEFDMNDMDIEDHIKDDIIIKTSINDGLLMKYLESISNINLSGINHTDTLNLNGVNGYSHLIINSKDPMSFFGSEFIIGHFNGEENPPLIAISAPFHKDSNDDIGNGCVYMIPIDKLNHFLTTNIFNIKSSFKSNIISTLTDSVDDNSILKIIPNAFNFLENIYPPRFGNKLLKITLSKKKILIISSPGLSKLYFYKIHNNSSLSSS